MVRVAELRVELHARVEQVLHLRTQLVVQVEVYFDDVCFNQFLILTAHTELSFIALGILFELEFFEFFVNFVAPVLCQAVVYFFVVVHNLSVKIVNCKWN